MCSYQLIVVVHWFALWCPNSTLAETVSSSHITNRQNKCMLAWSKWSWGTRWVYFENSTSGGQKDLREIPMLLCVCCMCKYATACQHISCKILIRWQHTQVFCSELALETFFDSVQDESQLANTCNMLEVHNPSQLTPFQLFPSWQSYLIVISETAVKLQVWCIYGLETSYLTHTNSNYPYIMLILSFVSSFWFSDNLWYVMNILCSSQLSNHLSLALLYKDN